MKNKLNPKVEAAINTTAVVLTGIGGTMIVQGGSFIRGASCIILGFALELAKYEARKRKIW